MTPPERTPRRWTKRPPKSSRPGRPEPPGRQDPRGVSAADRGTDQAPDRVPTPLSTAVHTVIHTVVHTAIHSLCMSCVQPTTGLVRTRGRAQRGVPALRRTVTKDTAMDTPSHADAGHGGGHDNVVHRLAAPGDNREAGTKRSVHTLQRDADARPTRTPAGGTGSWVPGAAARVSVAECKTVRLTWADPLRTVISLCPCRSAARPDPACSAQSDGPSRANQ